MAFIPKKMSMAATTHADIGVLRRESSMYVGNQALKKNAAFYQQGQPQQRPRRPPSGGGASLSSRSASVM